MAAVESQEGLKECPDVLKPMLKFGSRISRRVER